MFKYTLDNKRYHTLNYFYKTKFNSKVFKVSLNGNFSCPNFKNGSGCIFCSAKGSGDFAGNKEDDLLTQFNEIKKKLNKTAYGFDYADDEWNNSFTAFEDSNYYEEHYNSSSDSDSDYDWDSNEEWEID